MAGIGSRAGLAGGADVILIPEIPYDVDAVASSIAARRAAGSSFSIVAVAEGAISRQDAAIRARLQEQKEKTHGEERKKIKRSLKEFDRTRVGGTTTLASKLTEATGLEARLTILGHVQRGGTPSPGDRVLATTLGAACTDYIVDGIHGVMVAAKGQGTEAVSLKKVAGRIKPVPLDHRWINTARDLGLSLGD